MVREGVTMVKDSGLERTVTEAAVTPSTPSRKEDCSRMSQRASLPPDIKRQGLAKPVATIRPPAFMLLHLRYQDAADHVETAVESC
jgi:isocitrate/isopropylmalate dehydrogenase